MYMTFALICGFVYRPQSALMESSKNVGCFKQSHRFGRVWYTIHGASFPDNMSDFMVSFWNRLGSSRICLVSPEGGIYNFWSSGPLDWANY